MRNPAYVARAMDLSDALRASHDEIRLACHQLMVADGAEARIGALCRLDDLLTAHTHAEERYVYAPLLHDDIGLPSNRQGIDEHLQIEQVIARLHAAGPRDDTWEQTADDLVTTLHHHIEHEEAMLIPLSRLVLSVTVRSELAGRFRYDYERGRDRLRTS